MKDKKKIAILRGPSLSKWEMQIYEPLSKHFDLLGIGAKPSINDIEEIRFPCVFLPLRFGFAQSLPKYTFLMNSVFGDTRWLGDFDKTISGFDVLHTVELRTGFTFQAVRAKQKGIVKAVTATIYENIQFVGDEVKARLRLKQLVLPNIDHFFAANEEARQALLVEGVEASKISIVPQSVDTHVFHPASKSDQERLDKLGNKFHIERNDFVVLGVGRMVWEKGWYDIVRAAYKIQNLEFRIQNGKRIMFLCIGDGPEREKLTKLVKQLNLEDSVLFVGNISYKEMPDYFRIADVFVLASIPTKTWNEQFGGVLIEAMAAFLPIVGTTNGGIVSTVGKEGGIFVPPQDFAKLAQAIIHLYKNPQLLKKMGKRNREIAVRLYDVNKVSKSIGKIWRDLI